MASPSIVDNAGLSIAHRRLDKHADRRDSAPRIVTIPSLPRFDSEETILGLSTPTAIWSPDMTVPPIQDEASSPSTCSTSSLRSSFSDIEDEDYSSEENVDVFQARREVFKRTQPRKLRWEAGSLRREYIKQEAEAASSSTSALPTSQRSNHQATSFFHHNTLRRHNSTGNYSRAQMNQAALTPKIESASRKEYIETEKVVKDVPEAGKMLKSGGSRAQVQYDTRRKEAKAKHRHSTCPPAQISPRSSSLSTAQDLAYLQMMADKSESFLPLRKLQQEDNKPVSYIVSGGAARQRSPSVSELTSRRRSSSVSAGASRQRSPSIAVPLPTQAIVNTPKATFTLSDKLFSGIKAFRG